MTTPKSKRRRTRAVVWSLAWTAVVVLAFASCAAGPNAALGTGDQPAGFWLGLWHGFSSPVTFLVSLFTDSVSVYEVRNNGNWYDAGFMLGISTIFSSTARSGARRVPPRSRAPQDAA